MCDGHNFNHNLALARIVAASFLLSTFYILDKLSAKKIQRKAGIASKTFYFYS